MININKLEYTAVSQRYRGLDDDKTQLVFQNVLKDGSGCASGLFV